MLCVTPRLDASYQRSRLTAQAHKFAFAFTRMEYALKENGYCQPGRRETTPDWDRFANASPNLETGCPVAASAAIELYYNHPPMKQLFVNDVLEFQHDHIANRSNTRLFVLLRRVRNNLFHGAKERYGHRDEELIIAGLIIIEWTLELNPAIAMSFE